MIKVIIENIETSTEYVRDVSCVPRSGETMFLDGIEDKLLVVTSVHHSIPVRGVHIVTVNVKPI